jgi:hypothetical protein
MDRVLRRNMAESPENIVLAQLRAIRADLADVQGSLGEIKGRLGNLEGGQASISQHLAIWRRPMPSSRSPPIA